MDCVDSRRWPIAARTTAANPRPFAPTELTRRRGTSAKPGEMGLNPIVNPPAPKLDAGCPCGCATLAGSGNSPERRRPCKPSAGADGTLVWVVGRSGSVSLMVMCGNSVRSSSVTGADDDVGRGDMSGGESGYAK